MYKKYVDELTVKNPPINGLVKMEKADEKGNVLEYETALSNLPNAFENDEALANRNGYYKYIEDVEPEYDEETQYLSSRYTFDGKVITKIWIVNDFSADEVVE